MEKNIKDHQERLVSNSINIRVLGIPIYSKKIVIESNDVLYEPKDNLKETISYMIFNLKVLERVFEYETFSYFLFGKLIKKVNLLDIFYSQFLKKSSVEFHDAILLSNTGTGEAFTFITYLAKAFLRKNNLKNILFICPREFQTNILRMYLPDANYIFANKFFDYTRFNKCTIWYDLSKYGKGKMFVYSAIRSDKWTTRFGNSFEHQLHYVELDNNDVIKPKAYISEEIKNSALKKADLLTLNLNNFVIFAPEANSFKKIPVEFWKRLAVVVKNKGYDILLNLINEKHYIEGCKTVKLTHSEIFELALHAKVFISARSGFSETLLPSNVPCLTIYRRLIGEPYFHKIGIDGSKLLRWPFVDENITRDIDFNLTKNIDELLEQAINDFDYLVNIAN